MSKNKQHSLETDRPEEEKVFTEKELEAIGAVEKDIGEFDITAILDACTTPWEVETCLTEPDSLRSLFKDAPLFIKAMRWSDTFHGAVMSHYKAVMRARLHWHKQHTKTR
jgi:hypothetical protein